VSPLIFFNCVCSAALIILTAFFSGNPSVHSNRSRTLSSLMPNTSLSLNISSGVIKLMITTDLVGIFMKKVKQEEFKFKQIVVEDSI
jgi:hypothetical protein